MRTPALLLAASLGLGFLPDSYAAVLDLTTNLSITDGDATYTRTSTSPTGTGYIDSFVKYSTNDSVIQAYNTTANGVFNNGATNTFNHGTTIADIGFIANQNNDSVMRFLLDINQSSGQNKHFLSLDEVQLIIAKAPNQSITAFDANGVLALADSALAYRLDNGTDNYVKLDYDLNNGSGSGDMFLDISQSAILSAMSSLGLDVDNAYVYLYSKFGQNYPNNDGFEEWAAVKGTVSRVPEPGVVSLLGLSLLSMAGIRRRSARS